MATPPDGCNGMGEDVIYGVDEQQVAAIARALGSPVRRQIIELFGEPAPVMTSTIVADCGLAPSTVSRHLRILRDAGLLLPTRQGVRIWYCLNRPLLDAYAARLGELSEAS